MGIFAQFLIFSIGTSSQTALTPSRGADLRIIAEHFFIAISGEPG